MTSHADSAPFDAIASAYEDFGTDKTPIRKYAENHTVLENIWPLASADVLEVACSDGHFARLLIANGAKSVHAVDLSPEMIAAAKRKTDDPRISYGVADVLNLEVGTAEYDILISSFAQSYALNIAELDSMCRQLFAQLKPGGRILTLNDHPDFLPDREQDYRKYGKSKKCDPERIDGTQISVCWYCEDSKGDIHEIPFKCQYYHRDTLVGAFKAAGFTDVVVSDCLISTEGLEAFPTGYWDLLQINSLFCVITARKPDA